LISRIVLESTDSPNLQGYCDPEAPGGTDSGLLAEETVTRSITEKEFIIYNTLKEKI